MPLIDSYSHFSVFLIIDFLEKNGGRKPHVFRSLFANTPTLIDADFFSPGRLLFGSDCPMDATAGRAFTRDAVTSVQGLSLKREEKEAIFSGNAQRVLKLV